jgi:hypothetical protein
MRYESHSNRDLDACASDLLIMLLSFQRHSDIRSRVLAPTGTLEIAGQALSANGYETNRARIRLSLARR